MKVLVTGATGFLGGYIIDRLAQDKINIVAMGRNEVRGKELIRPNVSFFQGDFVNKEDVRQAMDGVTHVIHAGALSTVWGKWDDFYRTNVIGTQNILNACREFNVSRLVYISSPSVYADTRDRLNIGELDFDVNNQLNNYIQSKIMSEQLFTKYTDVPSVILRPRAIIGIGDTSVVPRLLKVNRKIGIPFFQAGQNLIDVTCVENVAYAIQLALFRSKAVGNIYNVTNDDPRPFKEILDLFFSEIDAKPKYRNLAYKPLEKVAMSLEGLYRALNKQDEPPITRYTLSTIAFSQTLDVSAIKEDLDYSPIMTLEEGVEKYADYYNQY